MKEKKLKIFRKSVRSYLKYKRGIWKKEYKILKMFIPQKNLFMKKGDE